MDVHGIRFFVFIHSNFDTKFMSLLASNVNMDYTCE